jgi:hypothetical protein
MSVAAGSFTGKALAVNKAFPRSSGAALHDPIRRRRHFDQTLCNDVEGLLHRSSTQQHFQHVINAEPGGAADKWRPPRAVFATSFLRAKTKASSIGHPQLSVRDLIRRP